MPSTRGLSLIDDATLRARAARAARGGFQVATHAIGDAANAQVLGAYEDLSRTYKGDRRWRIEHAQILDVADLPRFARSGIIASMQPTHQTSDRTMAEARLGPQRLGGAYAWQSLLRSSARLAFGSDFPVESPNPFPGLSAAISRQDPSGQPPGGWRPRERVSFEVALAGFTRGAAYAGFAEDRIGSLEPGKYADLSSSTAISARSRPSLWQRLACWKPGLAAGKSGLARRSARSLSIARVRICGSSWAACRARTTG